MALNELYYNLRVFVSLWLNDYEKLPGVQARIFSLKMENNTKMNTGW